ncbi:hypothetical protein K445DRAFT_132144 [Daldinia sp. EC12]|nr:hypothetical protein K445DRAFT_132144 [Daldinia sp. EC12]
MMYHKYLHTLSFRSTFGRLGNSSLPSLLLTTLRIIPSSLKLISQNASAYLAYLTIIIHTVPTYRYFTYGNTA